MVTARRYRKKRFGTFFHAKYTTVPLALSTILVKISSWVSASLMSSSCTPSGMGTALFASLMLVNATRVTRSGSS